MKEKVFSVKCAEALVTQIEFECKKAILKKRVKKNYRSSVLDDLIIKRRTKSEAKIIKTLNSIVNVPQIYSINQSEIIMEFIDGVQLKTIVEKQPLLCVLAGKEIKKIHNVGIIHGDLTTSNIIVRDTKEQEKELVFIDFGLGYFSKKIEDKATDLIVFKKTFNATHSKLKNGWDLVMQGYKPSVELKTRMQDVEKRARYH
jgi:Kae1-associated kinase Bud32